MRRLTALGNFETMHRDILIGQDSASDDVLESMGAVVAPGSYNHAPISDLGSGVRYDPLQIGRTDRITYLEHLLRIGRAISE